MQQQFTPFFRLQATDPKTEARAGLLNIGQREVETPVFMPVATLGSVKGVDREQLLSPGIDTGILLANTYHLYQRPGLEIISQAGGLHKFMGWNRAILTDSGGYQVFSLSKLSKISDSGVSFSSPIDGLSHTFTPEKVVDIQRKLASNIMMPLDECTPYDASRSYQIEALSRTHRWLDASMHRLEATAQASNSSQRLFPIIQGGMEEDLRKQSARRAAAMNVEGYAIGGLSVGEPADLMYRVLEWVCPLLPSKRPRYLMGVGTPENLLRSIARGIDMFDCVLPTRNGRNATLFTTEGRLNMRNAQWATCYAPLDQGLQNPVSQGYSRAYLRHLFMSTERLAEYLASVQNLAFYAYLMREARQHILLGDFSDWAEAQIEILSRKVTA